MDVILEHLEFNVEVIFPISLWCETKKRNLNSFIVIYRIINLYVTK